MIMLTGGQGFIGKHVADILEEFFVVDLKSGNDVLELTQKDIIGVDTVIHLAAMSSVPKSMADPTECYRQNILGLQRILDLKPKKIIFASSGSVVDPISPYALSKLTGEQMIANSGIDHCILRLGNVYGEGDDKSVIYHFLKDNTMTVTGNGKNMRSFVYVKDVARAFKLALEREGTYAIGSELLTINEVAEKFNKPRRRVPARDGETGIYDLVFDGMPGWYPKTNMKQWLESTAS